MKGVQARGRIPSDVIPMSLPPNMAYYLTGETYKYREMIKHNDGWWDKINRRWWMSADGWDKFEAEWDAIKLREELKEE